MPHHALEVSLTRPLTAAELHQAQHRLPLAPNNNFTRLMAVVRARTPDKALHRLRRRLDELLPIDVITTHYPDPGGQVFLNIAFPPAADTLIRRAADAQGQRPHIFVQQAVRRALAQQARQDTESIDHAVRQLLTRADAAHLLAALGRALTSTPGAPRC
ncbi:hypothetical protein [Streptomyces sp. NRRL B-24720]|uniref:hypothetical protein n=1 Tax=Streptomyces sp. NRRL B-24720 TaxID=1476876 RepID=UPI000A3DBB80|nr:hypothetical protein [Streptomyces sp. NRRL B-24720]